MINEKLKEKMFKEIIEKKYNWIIKKVFLRRISYERSKEIVHDAIVNFYSYHFKKFDFKKCCYI